MNELSLFTGAGGGLLGTKLLDWRTIGMVEIDDYCQRVLAQRQRDGHLDRCPIYGDIAAFNVAYARRYYGVADVITAGFPCQPFSTAGRQKGADDKRNMWPETLSCILTVRPRYALLENVPGLLSSGYFGTILGDLAAGGYDVRYRVLSAAELGAPHKRDRLWIACVADAEGDGCARPRPGLEQSTSAALQHGEAGGSDQELADALRRGQPGSGAKSEHGDVGTRSEARGWWGIEPDVGRVANGVASRVDRLKALGNGQVPAVVAAAWQLLTEQ